MGDGFDVIKEVFHKLDSLDKNVDGINITLAKQEVSLAEHMKRSNALEAYVDALDKRVSKWDTRWAALALLFGGALALLGAAEGIIKILDLLR